MSLKEDIRPISWLKSQTAKALEQINVTQRHVIITQNGKVRGILQDPESFEATHEAMAMLRLLARGEKDIREGRVHTTSEVFAAARARVKRIQNGK